ncbi:MAG: hypothetical protein CR990_00400 [Desulfococcus sp.]|nr:MAG: hypothetical protein CR990_00400 [Desulfococcus sp.]
MNLHAIRTERADDIAVLYINPPPFNRFSERLADELAAAHREMMNAPEIKAVIITGTGDQFVGGPEITDILKIRNRESLLRRLLRQHEVLDAIEQGPKPIIAAICGHCSRGGMELAMACHWRLAAQGVRLGLLDSRYGLIPHLGGTQRLPRLVGLPAALDIMIDGTPLSATQALEAGLVDAVSPARDFPAAAMDAARSFVDGRRSHGMRMTSRRFENLCGAEEKNRIFHKWDARSRQSGGNRLVAEKILRAVRQGTGVSFSSDIRREAELFCDCVFSDASRNLISLFLRTRQAGQIRQFRSIAPFPMEEIAMVAQEAESAGRIASALIRRGIRLKVWAGGRPRLAIFLQSLQQGFAADIALGAVSRDAVDRLIRRRVMMTEVIGDLRDIPVLLEAGPAAPGEKQEMIEKLAHLRGAGGMIASLTGEAPLTDILPPEGDIRTRLAGLHFFTPPHQIRLLEIRTLPETGKKVTATALELAKRAGKIPLLQSGNFPPAVRGLQSVMIREAVGLVQEGVNPASVDKAFTAFGFPFGPLYLSDIAGRKDRAVHTAGPEGAPETGSGTEPELLMKMMADGILPAGAGSGWYDHGGREPVIREAALDAVSAWLKGQGTASRTMPREDILGRILDRLAAAAREIVQRGQIADAADLDMGTVYGIGFPPHFGGLLKWADGGGSR